MKAVLKITGYNKEKQEYELLAINAAAPAKLSYNGAGVYLEKECARKYAEKLLKGFSCKQLEKYASLSLKVDGVNIACKNNVLGNWQFIKSFGLY